jgi:arginase
MTEIRLLAVPYEGGALRLGVGRGPERLLEAGAGAALASHGADVRLEMVELRDHHRDESGASEAGAGFELMRLVADRAREALAAGAYPVLLSGSCFAGVGVLTGLDEKSPAVVWFDAHGDFNTPESSIDGYFDGMGLATLTGSGWENLVKESELQTVPETSAVLAGARDFDPLEQERLEASALRHLPPSELGADDAVAQTVEQLDPSPTGVYLHLDLDVLDAGEARVNIYSAPGGLSADQLVAQVSSLLETCPIRAVSLTAYDPEVDAEGRVPPIAMRLLEVVAERVAREP